MNSVIFSACSFPNTKLLLRLTYTTPKTHDTCYRIIIYDTEIAWLASTAATAAATATCYILMQFICVCVNTSIS